MEIRPATFDDLPAIVELYNHHVLHGVATFDETPTTVEDRIAWFESYATTGPHRLLAADVGTQAPTVIGCAYSSPYRQHPAFAETVELGIYLAPAHSGQGLGTQLYTRLLDELASEPVHRAVAGIALPNEASVRLHRRFGFDDVGIFDEYATKWGRRISSLWMQRSF
jgi:phosphinothricin acetyltransferase